MESDACLATLVLSCRALPMASRACLNWLGVGPLDEGVGVPAAPNCSAKPLNMSPRGPRSATSHLPAAASFRKPKPLSARPCTVWFTSSAGAFISLAMAGSSDGLIGLICMVLNSCSSVRYLE